LFKQGADKSRNNPNMKRTRKPQSMPNILVDGICDMSPAAYFCTVIPLFEKDKKNNHFELAS